MRLGTDKKSHMQGNKWLGRFIAMANVIYILFAVPTLEPYYFSRKLS